MEINFCFILTLGNPAQIPQTIHFIPEALVNGSPLCLDRDSGHHHLSCKAGIQTEDFICRTAERDTQIQEERGEGNRDRKKKIQIFVRYKKFAIILTSNESDFASESLKKLVT